MAKSVLEILFKTLKQGSGDKETVTGMERLKSAFEQTTGISLTAAGAVTAVGAAVGAAVAFTSQAVEEWSAYAEQVDKASMATGIQSEEMSRLIQLADDFRVSQEDLTGAMKMAMQNGFQPTVENLAELSDQYLAMGSQTERVNLLQGIFGKQWQSMVPLLEKGGEAIRDANLEIDDSLVVTKEAIEANREYVKAVDDLEDAWQGVKNELAQGVIPTLTNVINLVNEGISRQKNQNEALGEGYGKVAGLAGAYGAVAQYQMYAAEQQERFNQRAQEANQYLLDEYNASQTAAEGLQIVGQAAGEMGSQFDAAAGEAGLAAQSAHEMAGAAERLATAEGNLKTAQEDLATAQENWKKGAGGQIAGMLEQSGLKADAYYAALDVVDDLQGTNEGTTARQKDAMQKLVDEYKRTGDLDAFRQGLVDLNSTFMPLDESIHKSMDLVDELQGKLNDFAHTYTATVRVHYETEETPGGGSTGDGDTGDSGSCFVAGTMVSTPAGMRAIEEIEEGEAVSVLTDAGVVNAPVIGLIRGLRSDLVTVHTSDGQSTTCSPNHKWKLWGGGWCWAGMLLPGALLVSDHGEVHVVRVEAYTGTHNIYNLTIDHPEHTFLVGGLVVHNEQAKAAGGPVSKGRMYLVGEDGPEMLQMTPGGRAAGHVYPNSQTRGSGVTIQQVVIQNGMDLEELIWKINRRIG